MKDFEIVGKDFTSVFKHILYLKEEGNYVDALKYAEILLSFFFYKEYFEHKTEQKKPDDSEKLRIDESVADFKK